MKQGEREKEGCSYLTRRGAPQTCKYNILTIFTMIEEKTKGQIFFEEYRFSYAAIY